MRAGPFTDWIVPECAAPCPNLFLASWGIQCGLGADQCCLRKDTLCVKTAPYAAELKPASWTGRNLTSTATGGSTNSTAPAPPKACTGGGKWFNASATQYWRCAALPLLLRKADAACPAGRQREPHRLHAPSDAPTCLPPSPTTARSYPPCCTDPTVDQTECVVYSGCKYEVRCVGEDGHSVAEQGRQRPAAPAPPRRIATAAARCRRGFLLRLGTIRRALTG